MGVDQFLAIVGDYGNNAHTVRNCKRRQPSTPSNKHENGS